MLAGGTAPPAYAADTAASAAPSDPSTSAAA